MFVWRTGFLAKQLAVSWPRAQRDSGIFTCTMHVRVADRIFDVSASANSWPSAQRGFLRALHVRVADRIFSVRVADRILVFVWRTGF
jgi:hypothetical protein